MKKEIYIIGSGLSGSVIARELAEKGYSIRIYDQRAHVAGNIYDFCDENGIIVQQYGPHIFHTSNETVHDYIQKYAKWNKYTLQCGAEINNQIIETPFSFKTLFQLYQQDKANAIITKLIQNYPGKESVSFLELSKSDDTLIREYANLILDKDIKPYTAKQWNLNIHEIDPKIFDRIPMNLSYDTNYFKDKYQLMPEKGFSTFIGSLLNHPNIKVHLNEKVKIKFNKNNAMIDAGGNCSYDIIYTGTIDELFNYKYGKLPYRTLTFTFTNEKIDSFQKFPVVAYPLNKEYTRVTEFKKLYNQKNDTTTYAKEYSYSVWECESAEPYYPVPTDKTEQIYRQYASEVSMYHNLFLLGRLAKYKYINMDEAILCALNLANRWA